MNIRTRRRARTVAGLFAVGLALVGGACSSDDEEPEAPTTTTAPPTDPALVDALLDLTAIGDGLVAWEDAEAGAEPNPLTQLCAGVSIEPTWSGQAVAVAERPDTEAIVGEWLYGFDGAADASAFMEELIAGVDRCNAGEDVVGLSLVPVEGIGEEAWVGEFANAETGAGVAVYVAHDGTHVVTMADFYDADNPRVLADEDLVAAVDAFPS